MSLDIHSHLLAPQTLAAEQEEQLARAAFGRVLLALSTAIAVLLVSALSVVVHVS